MLMLENLKKRVNLLQNLEEAIQKNQYKTVISAEKLYLGKPVLKTDANYYKTLFSSSDLAFAEANHGNIIGSLFALRIENNDSAILEEYLTIKITQEKTIDQKILEKELTALSIVISVFYPEIQKIKLPLGINEFNNQECCIQCSFDNCYLLPTYSL